MNKFENIWDEAYYGSNGFNDIKLPPFISYNNDFIFIFDDSGIQVDFLESEISKGLAFKSELTFEEGKGLVKFFESLNDDQVKDLINNFDEF